MIDTSQMTQAQIRRAAMKAVVREVGVVGLVTLLRDSLPASGDYVADRKTWLPEYESIDELMKDIATEGKAER